LLIVSAANLNGSAGVQSVDINSAATFWNGALWVNRRGFFFAKNSDVVDVQVRVTVEAFTICSGDEVEDIEIVIMWERGDTSSKKWSALERDRQMSIGCFGLY
jgi:hypothetical protein